jgi:hypothetical protein
VKGGKPFEYIKETFELASVVANEIKKTFCRYSAKCKRYYEFIQELETIIYSRQKKLIAICICLMI